MLRALPLILALLLPGVAGAQMKKEIVHKLSLMDSKVATDYMLELLNGK